MRGTWYTNEALPTGFYWIAEDDRHVVWVGEHVHTQDDWRSTFLPPPQIPAPPNWVHVFFGNKRVHGGRLPSVTVQGDWIDIPKACSNRMGTLSVEYVPGMNSFRRTHETGGFGDAAWIRPHPLGEYRGSNRAYEGTVAPGRAFQVARSNWPRDYTGVWLCDDGGTYYIRQIGDRVVWYGEKHDETGVVFANVFDGRRIGGIIRGHYWDVPKGRANSSGELTIRTHRDGHYLMHDRDGRFGGSRWSRSDVLEVDLHLDTLELVRTEDRGGDEPVLWCACFKIDGETVTFWNPASFPLFTRSFVRYWQREDLPRGTRLSLNIRDKTFLQTVRGATAINPMNARTITNYGFIITVIDRDESRIAGYTAAQLAFRHEKEAILNEWVRSLRPHLDRGEGLEVVIDAVEDRIGREVDNKISSHDWFIHDSDDYIDTEARIFSLRETNEALTIELAGDGALYRVHGHISILPRC